METKVLISNLAQNLMQQIPHPNDASDEIWFNWPAGLRDIYVWKCGRTDARTDWRRLESHTISSPWAFGSGELKKHYKCPPWNRPWSSGSKVWHAKHKATMSSCARLEITVHNPSIGHIRFRIQGKWHFTLGQNRRFFGDIFNKAITVVSTCYAVDNNLQPNICSRLDVTHL